MLRINSQSGQYTLIEPLDFGILSEYDMKDKFFLVHYIPEAQRILIKIVPNKGYLIFVKIKTKEFTIQVGKDLENLLKKINVLLSSGIFIVDLDYICELVIFVKNRIILSDFKREIKRIEWINFEIIELNNSDSI